MNQQFKVVDAFQNHFLTIRDRHVFSKRASLIIITFQQLQILSFIISEEMAEELELKGSNTLDFLIQVLKYFRLYTFFTQQDACNEAILTITMFVGIIGYVFLLIFVIYATAQKKKILHSRIIGFLSKILSCGFKLYYFITHWPLTLCMLILIKNELSSNSLNVCAQIGFIFSIPTFLISLIMFILTLMYSFTYQFKKYDYIYGEDNQMKYYQAFAVYVLLFSYVFLSNEAVIWIGLLFTVPNIFAQKYYIQFRDQFIKNWNQILQFEISSLIIIVILIKYFGLIQYFHFILLMICPLTYILSCKLIEIEDRIFHYQKRNSIISDHLDRTLRSIYQRKIHLKEYFGQEAHQTSTRVFYNIQLYALMTNHLANCTLESIQKPHKKTMENTKCFCLNYFPIQSESKNPQWKKYLKLDTEFSNSENEKHTISNEKEFRKFIFDFIKYQYEIKLEVRSRELHFSYITFLYEVLNQPTKAFYEALKLKQSVKGFKSIVIIKDLIDKSREKFNLLIQKEQLKNQKYDMISVFVFEQQLKDRQQDLLGLVQKYKSWYQVLTSQNVNFNQLSKQGAQILSDIQAVEEQVQLMFQANPQSSPLGQIIKIFYKFIHFNQPKPDFLKKRHVNLFKYNQSLLRELFDPESFVIQITLMQPRGTIINCTKQLYKYSGLNEKDILNQNIKIVIPDIIAQYHDQYLDTFVETGRMNVVKNDDRVLYIKTKDMFIVPVTAKVRIENYSNNDFGASALLNIVKTQYFYLLMNKYGMLEECCEKVYFNILKKHLKLHQQQLKGLDILKMMPFIYTVWEQLNNSEMDQVMEFQSNLLTDLQDDYLVIPKETVDITNLFENRKSQKLIKLKNYYKLQKNQMVQYLQHFNGEVVIYEVKYKIKLIHAINQNIIVLEIQNMKIVKQKSREAAMKRIYKIMDIDMESPQHQSLQVIKKPADLINIKIEDLDYDHDLDQEILLEDNNMIQNKQTNFDIYLKSSTFSQVRQETNITSVARQVSEINQCLLPFDSGAYIQIPNHENCNLVDQQIGNITQNQNQLQNPNGTSKILSSSEEEESNSLKKKDDDIQKVDACSISSSRNNDDLKTKKQTIAHVLDSNETDHSNLIGKVIFLFILTLCICYSINFGFIFYDEQVFNLIQQQQYKQNQIFYNSSAQAEINLKMYIIAYNNNTIQEKQIISFLEQIEELQFTDLNSLSFQPASEDNIYQGFYTLKSLLYLMIENGSQFYNFMIFNIFNLRDGFESLINDSLNNLNENQHNNQYRYKLILIFTEIIFGLVLLITLPTYMLLQQSKIKILKFFIRLEQKSICKSLDMFNVLYDQLRFQQNQSLDYDTEMLNIKSIYKTIKNSTQIESDKIKAVKAKSYTYENNVYVIILISIIIVLFFASLSAYLIISYLLKVAMIDDIDYISFYLNEIVTINHHLLDNQSFFTLLYLYPTLMYDNYHPFQNFSQYNTLKHQISDLSEGTFTSQIQNIMEQNACNNFELENPYYTECMDQQMNSGLIQLVIDIINQQDLYFSQIIAAKDFESFNDLIQNHSILEQLNQQVTICTLILNDLNVNLQKQILTKFSNQILIEIIIFILGLLFIVFFTLVIQRAFKQLLISQIKECQNLLRLVPFDIICNNAYIMSYITKRARSIKQ